MEVMFAFVVAKILALQLRTHNVEVFFAKLRASIYNVDQSDDQI